VGGTPTPHQRRKVKQMVAIVYSEPPDKEDPLLKFCQQQSAQNWELLEQVRALQSEVREWQHQCKVVSAERDHWRRRVMGE
jgi:hypothetical protein